MFVKYVEMAACIWMSYDIKYVKHIQRKCL